MKRIFILLTIFSVGTSYAQKKPKVAQAEKARVEGRLGDAKDIIDRAIEYPKIKDDGKTWYHRGLIYATLDTTSNEEFKSLSSNALEEAMKAFNKAEELKKGNAGYYVTAPTGGLLLKEQQIDGLWGYYLNEGVKYNSAKDFKTALKMFEKTQVIKPQDTTGYVYAAIMASEDKNYEVSKKHYMTMIDKLDYHSKGAYNTIIFIETSINKNDEEALKWIRKAREKFPNETTYARSEISALIRMEKGDEAMKELEKAIVKEPENPDNHFSLGVLLEETGDKKGAMAAYEKAIEADSEYYNAVYNLAVLNYNNAVELIKEKNNLGITAADLKKAESMKEEIQESLKTSLPNWEKANSLKGGDRQTLETLEYIYLQLKQNDKAEAIRAELDKMGDGE